MRNLHLLASDRERGGLKGESWGGVVGNLKSQKEVARAPT